MKQFKLIGLTGQSGAGKSTVAHTFADCGATVINADEIVASLYVPDAPCVRTIAACFGAEVLTENGAIDRQALAKRAFSSAENTALLGKIVHPFVTATLFERLRGQSGVVIYDAPQLFESGADVICDAVIAVTADEQTRLRRIMARDGISEEKALERIRSQLKEDFFRANADYLLENNENAEILRKKAEKLYKTIQSEVR